MNQQARGLLRFFAWSHLPPHLQDVSRPFAELAQQVAERANGPEGTVALRKLLEAKDCAVRDALDAMGPTRKPDPAPALADPPPKSKRKK